MICPRESPTRLGDAWPPSEEGLFEDAWKTPYPRKELPKEALKAQRGLECPKPDNALRGLVLTPMGNRRLFTCKDSEGPKPSEGVVEECLEDP